MSNSCNSPGYFGSLLSRSRPCISATPDSSFSRNTFIIVSLISWCTYWFLKNETVGNTLASAYRLVRSMMMTSTTFIFDWFLRSNRMIIKLTLCSINSALCYKSSLHDSPKSASRINAVRNSRQLIIRYGLPVMS